MTNETPDDDPSNTEVALDALGDPDCRRILHQLTEPMTAAQLTEACGMPQSTTYRKLRTLSDVGLVEELANLERGDGASRYAIAFEQLSIEHSETQGFELRVTRRERSAEERLAAMWSRMREET